MRCFASEHVHRQCAIETNFAFWSVTSADVKPMSAFATEWRILLLSNDEIKKWKYCLIGQHRRSQSGFRDFYLQLTIKSLRRLPANSRGSYGLLIQSLGKGNKLCKNRGNRLLCIHQVASVCAGYVKLKPKNWNLNHLGWTAVRSHLPATYQHPIFYCEFLQWIILGLLAC